jgi:hypothetical protein
VVISSPLDHFQDVYLTFNYRMTGSWYAMPTRIHPEIIFIPGTFSLFIAPSGIIEGALSNLLRRQRRQTLYLCGNYPVILQKLSEHQHKFKVRRALTIFQVLTILEESSEPLILVEHDRTLYDDNSDTLPYIQEYIRQKTATDHMVCIFATRSDRWLERFEPDTNRFIYIGETIPPVHTKTHTKTLGSQQSLNGLW